MQAQTVCPGEATNAWWSVVKKYNAHIMYNYAISQNNTTKGELNLKGIITRWYIVYRSKMHEEQQKK